MLLTVGIFMSGICKTILICSGAKSKHKDTVATFQFNIYEKHLENNDQIENEVIWSDGPSSEFENRYMVKLL